MERLVLGLKRPTASQGISFSTARSSGRSHAQGYWSLALRSVLSVVLNPSDNLLSVFVKLRPTPAALAGVLYALFAVGSFSIARATPQITPLGVVSENLWKVFLIGCAAYMGLVFASAIARFVMGGRGSFAGDFFMAGVAALPMAVLNLGSLLGLAYVWEILRIVTGSYSVLILYFSCTQISDIDESRSMVAVPGMILASLSAAALVAQII